MERVLERLQLRKIFQRIPGVAYLAYWPFCIFGAIYFPIAFSLYYVFMHVFIGVNGIKNFWGAYCAYHGGSAALQDQLEGQVHLTSETRDGFH